VLVFVKSLPSSLYFSDPLSEIMASYFSDLSSISACSCVGVG